MQLRLAIEASRVGDHEGARALATESLERTRRAGYRRGEPQALGLLARLEFEEGDADRGMELLQRAAASAGEIGFTWWQAGLLLTLAERARRLGRNEEASRRVRESLVLARRMGDRHHLVEGLALAAAAAAAVGRTELAGRLWGAIEAEEARGRVGQWEDYRDEYATAVLEHADADFERARAEGARLSLDEAADLALADA